MYKAFLFILFIQMFFSLKHPRLFRSRIYLKKDSIDTQNILNINSHHIFGENEVDKFLDENEFIKNKKLISISPGGIKGFYMLGICKYIKKNYDLDNYIFSGASAGAWNSLLLCFKRDLEEIQFSIMDKTIKKTNNLNELENLIKIKLLNTYTTNDFDLRRLFIGVTTIDNYRTNTTIFTGFDNLEDALNCCVASSHIPMITGGLTNVYRNILSFDGGFSKYPYLNTTKSLLHITPTIWKNNSMHKMSINDYRRLFNRDKINYVDMIDTGFNDSRENKNYLDTVFDIKI
jgi:hypothetical protein